MGNICSRTPSSHEIAVPCRTAHRILDFVSEKVIVVQEHVDSINAVVAHVQDGAAVVGLGCTLEAAAGALVGIVAASFGPAVQALETFAGVMLPGFQPVYTVLKAVVKLTMIAGANQVNAKVLGERVVLILKSLEDVIRGIAETVTANVKEYSSSSPVIQQAVQKYVSTKADLFASNSIQLTEAMQTAEALLKRYYDGDQTVLKSLWRGVRANSYKDLFEKVDTQICAVPQK